MRENPTIRRRRGRLITPPPGIVPASRLGNIRVHFGKEEVCWRGDVRISPSPLLVQTVRDCSLPAILWGIEMTTTRVGCRAIAIAEAAGLHRIEVIQAAMNQALTLPEAPVEIFDGSVVRAQIKVGSS